MSDPNESSTTGIPQGEEPCAVEAEAVPPRPLLGDDDGGDANHQEDQVGFEARDTSSPPIDYEAIQEDDKKEVAAAAQEADETEAEAAREGMWNPSQGVQAEAEKETGGEGQQQEAAMVRRLSEQRPDVVVVSSSPKKESSPTTGAQPYSIAEDTYTPSREIVPGQKKEGKCPVILIVEPMRFRVRLDVPVYISESEEAKKDAWTLIAKDLFETIAAFLKVHPESFHLYKNSTDRIRFMSVLFVDRDKSAEGGDVDISEPVWVTLVFPPPKTTGKTEFNFHTQEDDDDSQQIVKHLREEDTDSQLLEEMLERVPEHLAQIRPDEQLVRCIRVRKEMPFIHPNTLVEARQKHGLTYDQVIESIQRAAAEDSEVAVVSVIKSIVPGGKAFLGGYRDKNDHSRRFLHASTQLFMKNLSYSPFGDKANAAQEMCSRQTQTYGVSRSCQTLREFSSQTPRTDVLLDDTATITVAARPYFTAAELQRFRTEKAITLQKFYRQWKARGVRRELEEAEAEKQRRAAARQRAEESAKMDADQREQLRLSEPRTIKDFEALKEQITRWRESESIAIKENPSLTAEEKRMAQLALTKQELKLLQEVESRRRETLIDRKDRQFDHIMDKTSSARNWGAVQVETPETQRAGELRDLYRALTDRSLAQTSRLDVLLHVKWTVKEFESPLTQELAELIDREADLLQRGRREASLDGLRTRIQNLMKQFIEDPEYNPMMAQYTKTATGRAKARQAWEKKGNTSKDATVNSTYLRSKDTKHSTYS